MSEALRALRRSLGPDALIAETKNLTKDLGGGVEITALAQDDAPEEACGSDAAGMVRAPSQPIEELREELALLKSMLGWLAPGLGQQDKLIKSLVTHGVTPENISKLLHAMDGGPAVDKGARWRHAMSRLLPVGGAIGASGGPLALIGPSGVGKTSALIKLTLFECRRRQCRVGWVSMDERRLNAADPLMAYSGILGVRFERAATRSELKLALDQLADCNLILIDTPGTNPRDHASIAQLAKSLRGIGGVRSMLLLSAVTNGADLADWVDNYRTVGLHSLLFTKLDECRYLGPLLNTALNAAVPLSYIAFGQSLAEDLALATPEVFASLLVTGVVND